MRASAGAGTAQMYAENIENVAPVDVTVEEVSEDEKAKKSAVWFWLGLGVLYLVWDYFVLKQKKLSDSLDPANIRTNLYNIMFIGFAAVIFVNGMKVFLVKMAAFNIPFLSPLATRLLPLFQLK